MNIILLEHPNEYDWIGCKSRALVTVGKSPVTPPTAQWMNDILQARHSPIRYLRFSFYLEIPYWVSVHLARHIHAQPYIQSQRNDRQNRYDRKQAPQDAPVKMIWDINAEELMVIANKRLCSQASEETRDVVRRMCDLVVNSNPEFAPHLVPMCLYHGGVCHEFHSCGMCGKE